MWCDSSVGNERRLSPATVKSTATAEAAPEATATAESSASSEPGTAAASITPAEPASAAEAFRLAAGESAEAIIAGTARLRLAIRPRVVTARVRPSA